MHDKPVVAGGVTALPRLLVHVRMYATLAKALSPQGRKGDDAKPTVVPSCSLIAFDDKDGAVVSARLRCIERNHAWPGGSTRRAVQILLPAY